MSWQDAFEPRKEAVLVSVKQDGNPHGIYVLSMGVENKTIIVGVCLMKTTLNNIVTNDKVVLMGKSDSDYYRIYGKAKIYTSGKYLETAISHSRPPMPTKAMTIDVEEVYDLGNGTRIL